MYRRYSMIVVIVIIIANVNDTVYCDILTSILNISGLFEVFTYQ